jgi:hypothetical protein
VTDVLYSLADRGKIKTSILLTALARLCMPARSGPRTRAVVTYNFDDVFERYLIRAAIRHRSIYREASIADRDELPVYHVHGFLPENRGVYADLDRALLVFSEEGYHDLYSDPYHWSNLVQLNLLRETTVLMIGLSLTDPNLRRLLEIAGRRNGPGRHFALLPRTTEASMTRSHGRPTSILRIDTIRKFLENHHQITTELVSELGINVIWYEDHAEVPSLIDKIRGA